MNQISLQFEPEAKPEPALCQELGLFRMGDATMALPVENLREVVPCPETLAPGTATCEALCGMIELRGTIIPVVDLRAILGLEQRKSDDLIILIMRHDGHLLGLMAHSVVGIVEPSLIRTSEMLQLRPALRPNLVTSAFGWHDDIVSMLNAEAIFSISGVPIVREIRSETAQAEHGTTEPFLKFRCAQLNFAISANSVYATIPSTEILDSPLKNGFCFGIVVYHNLEIPVVDTFRALGIGRMEEHSRASVVIVHFPPKGLLGLVLDEVQDVSRIALSSITAMPPLLVRNESLFDGVMTNSDTSSALVISPAGLQANADLKSMAGLAKPVGADATSKEDDTSAHVPADKFLVFSAGGEMACHLEDVVEILDFPTNLSAMRSPVRGVKGYFLHRGTSVPVISVCDLLATRATQPMNKGRVLLVRSGDHVFGFAIESLKAILPGRVRSTLKDDGERQDSQDRFLAENIVETVADGQKALVSFVNFPGILQDFGIPVAGRTAA